MLGVLGYVLLAALIGASTALLGGGRTDENGFIFLALLCALGLALAFAGRRFFLGLSSEAQSVSELVKPIALIVTVWMVFVVLAQAAISQSYPTASGYSAGVAYGLAMFALWLERKPSVDRARIAVFVLYFAAALIALAALMGFVPAAAFWVVSAVIPAWQAGRFAAQHQESQAFRLITAAIRLFAWVLAVGLAVPVLLEFR